MGEGMSTYVESLRDCKRLADLYEAEYEGLICAAWSDECPTHMFSCESRQRAFERGYERGKAQIQIEAAMRKTKEGSNYAGHESKTIKSAGGDGDWAARSIEKAEEQQPAGDDIRSTTHLSSPQGAQITRRSRWSDPT